MTITDPASTPQSDERPDSLTRAQVLAARGYAPETMVERRPPGLVIFDGGEAPAAPSPILARVNEPAESRHDIESTVRRCGACGASLEGRSERTKWCSKACKERGRQPRRYKRPGVVKSPTQIDVAGKVEEERADVVVAALSALLEVAGGSVTITVSRAV